MTDVNAYNQGNEMVVNEEIYKSKLWLWSSLIIPYLIICLSTLVLIGWFIGLFSFVSVLDTVPMQFNTALCLLLCALTLITLAKQYSFCSRFFALLATLISLMTLFEYIFDIDLYLDTLIVTPFTDMNTMYMGRMAPNTALALFILSACLSGYCFHKNPKKGALFFSLLISFSLAISIGALIGYLLGIKTAYAWNNYHHMTLANILCISLLNFSFLCILWYQDHSESLWLPLPIFITLFTVSLALSITVYSQEQSDLKNNVKSEAANTSILIQQYLDNLLQALNRMAIRWEHAGPSSDHLWQADAKTYIHDFPYLIALELLNKNSEVQDVVPFEPNKEIIGKNLNTDSIRQELIREAIAHKSIVLSPVLTLKQGGKGFLIFVPLAERELFSGFLVGVFRAQDFFNTVFKRSLFSEYQLFLYENEELLYANTSFKPHSQNQYSFPIYYKNLHWTLVLSNPEGISLMYLVLFVIGLLMSLLISICSYLILRLYQKTRALTESEETFRSAMNYAAIGMALISPAGRWLKVNKSLCQMLGYSEQELLNLDFQTVTHPDDIKSDLTYIKQMLAQDLNAYQIEKRYLHKSGTVIWVLLSVSLVWHDENTPKYFIAQLQNISDRKQFEYANSKLMLALEQSNKELEAFAYVASHDLQEPVRMINGFVDIIMVEKRPLLDAETVSYLDVIHTAGERIKNMVQDLLAYSRVSHSSMVFAEFSLDDTLKAVKENLNVLITEHHAVIKANALPRIKGNAIQIMRLLQNLITNAIKYQPKDQAPLIEITVTEANDFWEIAIKDNGLGIPESQLSEIFKPFKRLHSWDKIKGSGLGLAICKKIVELHQGNLSVLSTPGLGSTFIIKLPKEM